MSFFEFGFFEPDVMIDATIQTTWEWTPVPPVPPTPVVSREFLGWGRLPKKREKEIEAKRRFWLLGDLIIEQEAIYKLYGNLLRASMQRVSLESALFRQTKQQRVLLSDLVRTEAQQRWVYSKLSLPKQMEVKLQADLAKHKAVQLQAYSIPLTDQEKKVEKRLRKLSKQLELAMTYLILEDS